jgi:hypothetical protein
LELQRWAQRHFYIENRAHRLSLTPFVDIDPFDYPLVSTGISEATLICLESMRMNYNTVGLWQVTLDGRPYGDDVGAVAVDVPDPIETPQSDPPPDTPPYTPVPPAPVGQIWPTEVWVGTRTDGVYYTTDFTGPTGSQPTWTAFNTGLNSANILGMWANRSTETVFALTEDTDYGDRPSVWRLTSARSAFVRVLTEADVDTALGTSDAYIRSMYVDNNTGYVWVLVTADGDTLLWVSTSDGQSGTFSQSCLIVGPGQAKIVHIVVDNSNGIYLSNKSGGGNSGRIYWDAVSADNWDLSDSLGISTWDPAGYYDPYTTKIYASNVNSYLKILDKTDGSWDTPSVGYDLEGLCSRWDRGYPRMAFEDGKQRTLADGAAGGATQFAIYVSDDNWDTHVTEGACGRTAQLLWACPFTDQSALILARDEDGTLGDAHVIYVNDDDGATTPVERAGSDPQNASTTTSIPYNCGGVTNNGVAVVK